MRSTTTGEQRKHEKDYTALKSTFSLANNFNKASSSQKGGGAVKAKKQMQDSWMLLTDDISLGEQHNFMAGYFPV